MSDSGVSNSNLPPCVSLDLFPIAASSSSLAACCEQRTLLPPVSCHFKLIGNICFNVCLH